MGGVVPGDALTRDPAERSRLRRRLVGVGLGIVGWLGYVVLSRSPGLAEALAGAGPLPELARGLSLLTGVLPFSLAELVVVGFVARQVAGGWRGVGRFRREEEGGSRLLAWGGLRFAQDVGILVFLFYFAWGFQYARPGLEARIGVDPTGEVSVGELERLVHRSIHHSNALYLELHGSEDAGRATPSPPVRELVPGLEEGFARVRAAYGLHPRLERTYGAPKGFLASPLFRRFGTAGMYFPYTGEALILGNLPGVITGTTLAHEMAHQRGFSSESDANALAVLVARESPDALARYAAAMMLQRQLLGALRRIDAEAARSLERDRVPGVRRDLEELSAFWEPARGAAGATASRMNDAMLRSHGIPEGVASYAGSAWIFVAIARERGEEALF